jgi:preprotein translocase subunit SecG
MIRTICLIVLIALSVVLTVLVLMQEGKSAGLGSIAGAADTYWGKVKGRSMEGRLVKATKILVAGFFVLSILLNMNIF